MEGVLFLFLIRNALWASGYVCHLSPCDCGFESCSRQLYFQFINHRFAGILPFSDIITTSKSQHGEAGDLLQEISKPVHSCLQYVSGGMAAVMCYVCIPIYIYGLQVSIPDPQFEFLWVTSWHDIEKFCRRFQGQCISHLWNEGTLFAIFHALAF